MAKVARVWSHLPTSTTVTPSFVTGIGVELESHPLHPIHRLVTVLHHPCPQKDHLRLALVGRGWLLSMLEEEPAVVQKNTQIAHLRPRCSPLEHALSFHTPPT